MLQNTRRVVTEALGDKMTADGAPDVEVVVQGGSAAHVLVSAAVGSPLLVVVAVVRLAATQDRVAISELSGAPAAIL